MIHSGEYTQLKRGCTQLYQVDTVSINAGLLGQYAYITKAKNEERRENFRDFFDPHDLDLLGEENFGILEFGSGGRLECGPDSQMDLIIISDDDDAKIRVIADHINDRYKRVVFETDFKLLGTDSIVNYQNNPHNPRPSRSYDANLIMGDKSGKLVKLFQKDLVQEVKAKGKNIQDQVRSRVRQFKQISRDNGCQQYGGQVLQHFDLDEGVMSYDPSKRLGSFKYGPLRMVQMQVAADITKTIRHYDSPEGFVERMPKNTVDKLLYFYAENLSRLPESEIRELGENYDFFLWLYHKSQHAYFENKVSEVEICDPQIVRERMNNTIKLVEGSITNTK